MKIKSILFSALILAMSTVTFANNNEPGNTGFVVVPVQNNQVFKVIYKGEQVGKVTLTIYSQSGKTIYSESFYKTNGFICPMNFTGLLPGTYTITLTDTEGKKTETVEYKK